MELEVKPHKRPRRQNSCTECYRRKQKCVIRGEDVPCVQCIKRYPPVQCVRRSSASSSRTSEEDPRWIHHCVSFPALTIRPCSEQHPHISKGTVILDSGTSEAPLTIDEALKSHNRGCARTELSRSAGASFILDGDGDPQSFGLARVGGILTEISTLNGFPLLQNSRNAELLHFYLRFVTPNLTSIDGQSQPELFKREVLSWQLQSPIFPAIGLLMASTTQSLSRGTEVDRNPESLALRATVLSFLKTFIAQAEKSAVSFVAAEAVKCIINLVVTEWFWGTDESMMAHALGVRELLRVRGGLRGLHEPVAEAIVMLTDYEIACCFEQGLYWLDGDPAQDEALPTPTSWPTGYDSPLVVSATSFAERHQDLELSLKSAQILDDVRFLVSSITSTEKAQSTAKIKATAQWLHNKLTDLPSTPVVPGASTDDVITETIRLTALLFSRAIMTVTPLSEIQWHQGREMLYATVTCISLTRWKTLPGIFLWIMLVLCPGTGNDPKGRYIRRKMAVTGLSIGFEDFPLAIAYLRSFWVVQRWIASTPDDLEGDGQSGSSTISWG